MLTQQLEKLFNDVHAEDGCQLIFTTHEDAIMSYEYFRRDEIWFVERTGWMHETVSSRQICAGRCAFRCSHRKEAHGGKVRWSAPYFWLRGP
jgi:AAA15 family ATPase/GTPase